jgi:DNA-binding transcriptional ArsR family regulator
MPGQDFIEVPEKPLISVAVAPAQHAVYSLLLLTRAGDHPGLGEWVTRTVDRMTPEERHRNRLVTFGLHYSIVPEGDWPSFSAYVDHLAAVNPVALRDKLLASYLALEPLAGYTGFVPGPDDVAWILESVENYLDMLRGRFHADIIDEELESEAYTYAIDPPRMRELIVSHLRYMWDHYLEAEWRRVEPMLRDSERAFQQIDLSSMSRKEAVQLVLDKDLDGKSEKTLECAEQITFVPSAHIGPYHGKLCAHDRLWIVFGARLPEGVQFDAPDLSRTEIVVRLSALADDTRLSILKLVSTQGEKRSQDIMDHLGLSQSAASRHLKQLSATGYLDERRCEGAKCYTLNPERIKRTLGALHAFLLEK